MAQPDDKDIKFLFGGIEKFEISGKLNDVSIPRIFFLIKARSLSGVLSVVRSGAKKMISFECGDPKFVVSNIVEEFLGRVFVANGKITDEQCEESIKLMHKFKKKQGEMLIKMGLLEPFEIDEALKAQARERLTELFSWLDGAYKFMDKRELRQDLMPIDISVPQIVLHGVRRHYTLDILRRYLGFWMDHVPIVEEKSLFKLDDFKFATWESKIVRDFDGSTTLRKILNKRATREIDVYHVVFALGCLNVLGFWDVEAPKREREELASKRKQEFIRLRRLREKRAREAIELTKEFLVGKGEKRSVGKNKYVSFALIAFFLAVFALITYGVFFKDRIDFSKYGREGIIRSASQTEDVLVLISQEGWNPAGDKEVTRTMLEELFPQLREDGFKKVKLQNSSGRLLGVVISDRSGNFTVKVY